MLSISMMPIQRRTASPRAVDGTFGIEAATPLGLCRCADRSQGSSFLATLGFGSESLWDCLSEMSKLQAQVSKPALLPLLLAFALGAWAAEPVVEPKDLPRTP